MRTLVWSKAIATAWMEIAIAWIQNIMSQIKTLERLESPSKKAQSKSCPASLDNTWLYLGWFFLVVLLLLITTMTVLSIVSTSVIHTHPVALLSWEDPIQQLESWLNDSFYLL